MKSASPDLYERGGVTRKRAWSFDVLSKERDRKITRYFAESPAGGTTRYNPVASELNLPGASHLCYRAIVFPGVFDGERSRGAFICRTVGDAEETRSRCSRERASPK